MAFTVSIPNLDPAASGAIPLTGSSAITGPLDISSGAEGFGIGKATFDSLGQSAISVGTMATTLVSVSGKKVLYCVITGDDGSGNAFLDRVAVEEGPAATRTVLESQTIKGSPAARTYAMSTTNLQLSMASGTYSVRSAVISLPA